VDAPCEDKGDDVKDSLYEEVGRVFYQFSRYDKKSLLHDFNAKVGRKDILKPMIKNETSYKISTDNGVIVVNFATSKNSVVKSTMFPYRNIHKYTGTSPEGK
jgi:competence protein ComGF